MNKMSDIPDDDGFRLYACGSDGWWMKLVVKKVGEMYFLFNEYDRQRIKVVNFCGWRPLSDAFSALPGVCRTVPGNCYCLACHSPVPIFWTILE